MFERRLEVKIIEVQVFDKFENYLGLGNLIDCWKDFRDFGRREIGWVLEMEIYWEFGDKGSREMNWMMLEIRRVY